MSASATQGGHNNSTSSLERHKSHHTDFLRAAAAPSHRLLATKCARPQLLHAACSDRIPFIRTRVGVGSAKRVFVPGDLDL